MRFNGTAASFSVSDATHIAATVPAGATSGTVSVVTPGGTATSAASFTVTVPVPGAPVVTSFSPTAGKYRSIVYIYGTGFTGATKVKFNTASATFAVVSATQIKAAVPYGATTVRSPSSHRAAPPRAWGSSICCERDRATTAAAVAALSPLSAAGGRGGAGPTLAPPRRRHGRWYPVGGAKVGASAALLRAEDGSQT